MKWFKRKLRNWVREAENDYDCEKSVGLARADESNRPEDDPILTFRIYSANNGQVLEFRRWDRKADRSFNSTYIIEKDKDIGDYVSKCLSMELLK